MEQFGKYQLIRRVGTGGMAEVFLARTTVAQGLNKHLVIKKIHPAYAKSRQFTAMFVDEAKIALSLNHPNIVQVFDFGTVGGTYFLAMEHVEGLDLLRLMQHASKQGQLLPLGLCAYIVQQVAKGLDYAHRKTDEYGEPLGIVHRDVSPQNVLISWDGAVKIVDFGIARARHVQEDEGVVKGKFAYMSPEQARGESVDRRSDVYSAGVILFELCCGRALYQGKGKEVLEQVKTGAIPSPREINPELPPELEATIVKALTFHRDDRFQTARDLQRALGRLQFDLAKQEDDFYDSSSLAQLVSQLVPANRRSPTSMPPSAQELDQPPARAERGDVADGTSPGSASEPVVDTHLPVTPKPTPPRETRQRKYVFVIEARIEALPEVEARLGKAVATAALSDFYEVARNIAYKHDAHVHRLEDGELTFVVGLPVAGDDDASRSIRLVLALTEALDGIFQDSGIHPRLRTGIQRGAALLIRGTGADFTYEIGGATTSIARRLADAAQGGQVLVGGTVYRVAGSDWLFDPGELIELPDTESHADTELETGSKQARVYTLRGPKAAQERRRDRHRSSGKLIGRALELKALRDAYRDVLVAGRKRHILLVGDAGIGKRALVDTLAAAIPSGEAIPIRAVARAATSYTPFALIADLLREYLGLTENSTAAVVDAKLQQVAAILYPGDEGRREVRGLVQILGMILGSASTGESDFDAAERRQRLLDAMVRVEKKLSSDAPLVLIIEDIHWADQESMDFFLEFLKAPARRGILALVTTRPDSGFIKTVRDAQADVLQLEELEELESLELIARRFEPNADVRDLARQIVSRTGGNPFFINETLDALVDQGILVVGSASSTHPGLLRWVQRDAPIQVPTSIEALLATRIDRLPETEKDVLMHAAVLGKNISPGAVEASLERPVNDDLHRLMVRGLIRKSTTGFAFRNDMTVHVAYSLIPYEGRVELHQRAAKNLLSSPAYRTGQDDAIVARHLELAGDHDAASDRYLRAAAHAVDVGGNAEAFRLLTRALKLLDDKDHEHRFVARRQREEILRRLARRPAQLREIHHLRKEAEALGDPAKIATAHARLAQFYIDMGRPQSAIEAIPAALASAEEAGDRLAQAEVMRLQASIARLAGQHDEAVRISEEALALCGEDRDGLLQRALILNNLGTTLWNMGSLQKASEAYAEGLVIYRMLKLPRQEAQLLNNMGIVFSALGEYEEALAHFKSSLKLDQKLGDRAGIALKLGNIGQTYSDLGDLGRGRRYLDKALKLTEQTEDRTTRTDVLISLGQCLLADGRPAAAVEAIHRGLELASASRDRYQEVRARIYLALAQLEAKMPVDRALELARSATSLAQQMPMPVGEVYGLAVQGLALAEQGETSEAAKLAGQAVERQQSSNHPEGKEQILHIYASLAEKAGELDSAREAIRKAQAEVEAKAARLQDEGLRQSYLAARVPSAIQADFLRLTQRS